MPLLHLAMVCDLFHPSRQHGSSWVVNLANSGISIDIQYEKWDDHICFHNIGFKDLDEMFKEA